MSVLVDDCRWPWRGRRWCHLVSDDHLDELHAFARRLGAPRRGFQGDHYDLHEEARAVAVALGAEAVGSRELLARLRAAGLRLPASARRAGVPTLAPLRADPEAWLGRPVTVQVDRPVGSPHGLTGGRFPVNAGPVVASPYDAYVVGAREPLASIDGPVVAVVQRHDDLEDKLVVATGGTWPASDVAEAVAFQEEWFTTTVVTEAAAASGRRRR